MLGHGMAAVTVFLVLACFLGLLLQVPPHIVEKRIEAVFDARLWEKSRQCLEQQIALEMAR